MFLSLSCGNYKGKVSIAKPLYLLAVIQSVLEGLAKNCLVLDDEKLLTGYKLLQNKYHDENGAAMRLPYFHLDREPFYHLVWRDGVTPPPHADSPSSKYLREHLLYAKLDDELWDLLQDTDCCKLLMQSVIDRYLTPEKTL